MNLAQWLRSSHIAVGFLGLVAFWIPILVKKGGRVHIVSGRIFEICGYYVAATALLACARYLLGPYAFGQGAELSAEQLREIHFAQFLLVLLSFLALLFLATLRTGMRVVRLRRRPVADYQSLEARFWLLAPPVAGLALALFSAARLWTWGSSYLWISLVLGLVPLGEFRKELRFYRAPQAERMGWWFKHMDCMLGCGIPFHTAGAVFVGRFVGREFGWELFGPWELVPWILPSAVGIPWIHFWIAQQRRRFGTSELSDSVDPQAVPSATP